MLLKTGEQGVPAPTSASAGILSDAEKELLTAVACFRRMLAQGESQREKSCVPAKWVCQLRGYESSQKTKSNSGGGNAVGGLGDALSTDLVPYSAGFGV